MTTNTRFEKPPDLIADAPLNYENNHLLPECPFCKTPDPYLGMIIPVREQGYFDIIIYQCEGKEQHVFSAKHEIGYDASHLKIYNRTDIWNTDQKTRDEERMKETREMLRKG